jgi:hypothetical protein
VGQRRPPPLREQQRTEALDLFLRAVPTGEIARRLGTHRNQIARDLSEARRTFVEEQRAARVERIAQELAKIDNLERTYWEAWERSLTEQTRTITGREDVPMDIPAGARLSDEGRDGTAPRSTRVVMLTKTKAQRRVDQGPGNPAYLAGIQWCIDRRIKLLGLDEPVKVNVQARVRAVAEELGVDVRQVEAAVKDVHAVWSRAGDGPSADSHD